MPAGGQPAVQPGGALPPAPGGSSLWRATLALTRAEILSFLRNWMSLVFVLMFPVLMLLIFGAIFNDDIEAGGETIPQKQLFMAGIIAVGVMSTGFQGIAIDVVFERDSGLIRRFATTPMPRAAYFIAKFVRVLVLTFIEVLILLAISVGAYGLPIPDTAERWLTFCWVIVLGTFACTLMGMAFSALIPSMNAAPAMATPIFLLLQFISGVYFPLGDLPSWLVSVGEVFPLKWMAQGLRAVFLPDAMEMGEPRESWELGTGAIVLVAWVIVGSLITWRTFRWRGQKVL